MNKKILIDLSKFRECNDKSCDITPPEGIFTIPPNINGLKTIRELAVFQFTCRKCEDAPCINVCPAEALEKDMDGLIHRYTNLCISCKSCVTICPFGTMMTDFFIHKRDKDLYFDLSDEHELNEFIKACPAGAVTLVDMDENPEENIYKLNDRVLVKENIWNTDKQ
ncbi:MAG: 4Fe-4S binding protein [Bacteroidales bacterium]|nr:4Fe-4S binding protein [Bacteroidales bacterium]